VPENRLKRNTNRKNSETKSTFYINSGDTCSRIWYQKFLVTTFQFCVCQTCFFFYKNAKYISKHWFLHICNSDQMPHCCCWTLSAHAQDSEHLTWFFIYLMIIIIILTMKWIGLHPRLTAHIGHQNQKKNFLFNFLLTIHCLLHVHQKGWRMHQNMHFDSQN